MERSDRAFRITVDSCKECMFMRRDRGIYKARCLHPITIALKPDKRDRVVDVKEAPPEWCDLRGVVTMIEGPSYE